MSEINAFLQALSAQGSRDSAGSFTISSDRAREKMSRFRLLDPHLFVLNLVSVAVLGEATFIKFEYSNDQTTISFDGRRFTQTELLQAYVSEEPALRELAVALEGALGTDPEEAHFQSVGGLRLVGETWQEAPGSSIDNSFVLSKPSSRSLLSRLRRDTGRPEWASALGSCELAPLRLTLNGVVLTRSVILTKRALCLRSKGKSLRFKPLSRTSPVIHSGEAGKPYAAILGFSPSPTVNGLTIVCRGVSYRVDEQEFYLGGLTGVIAYDDLHKNVSHSDLVRERQFNELREAVWQDVLKTVARFDFTDYWDNDIDDWPALVLAAAENVQMLGHRARAMEMVVWVCSHQYLHELKLHVARFSLEGNEGFAKALICFYWQRMKERPDWSRLLNQILSHVGLEAGDESFVGLFNKVERVDWFHRLELKKHWHFMKALLQVHEDDSLHRLLKARLVEIGVSEWVRLDACRAVAERLGESIEQAVFDLLDNALVSLGATRRWLVRYQYHDLVKKIDARTEALLPEQLLTLAGNLLSRIAAGNNGQLPKLHEKLKEALKSAWKSEQTSLARDIEFKVHVLGDGLDPLRYELDSGVWSRHRAACLLMMRGELEEARRLLERARSELTQDCGGWSAVLMGDLERAYGHNDLAGVLYEEAREVPLRGLTYPEEALAAVSQVPSERCRLWVAYAESQQGLSRYLAYEEAARAARACNFIKYVVLLIQAGRASMNLYQTELDLLTEVRTPLQPERFIELSLQRPEVTLDHIRMLEEPRRTGALAHFRLLSMLNGQHSLNWDINVRDL